MSQPPPQKSPWEPLPPLAKRGLLIAVDGLDGTGLSTQTSLLCSWLAKSGHRVHATKEPTAGPAGAMIRLALAKRLGGRADGPGARPGLDETALALLFAADRADHLAQEVVPLLQQGVTVVTDRYLLSSFAYQAVHVDAEWFERVNSPFPPADLTVYLDVSPPECMRRIHGSRWQTEKNEGVAELTRIREQFHRALERVKARGWRVEHLEGIDGDDADAVHRRVVKAVEGLPLPRAKRS